MLGQVDRKLEACIQLPLLLGDGSIQRCEPVIDTGFTGELVLPTTFLEQIGATRVGSSYYQLADGTRCQLERFEVIVLWHDIQRKVEVVGSDNESLIGMELLIGSTITIDVEIDGKVSILPLHS